MDREIKGNGHMNFQEIRSKITVYTAVDDNRLKLLHNKVNETKGLSGEMAEIGVYKGGSTMMIGLSDPDRGLYACDSFEGLPETSKEDIVQNGGHSKGDFADTSLEGVRQLIGYDNNTLLIKGFFPDKVIHEHMEILSYSFVHIDVDLYQPTLDSLNFFWDRMVKDGIIVSDDYQWRNTPGVKTAFDEFFKDKDVVVHDSGFNSCWVKKK
jgi:predicted O-methyltransferase YrrM